MEEATHTAWAIVAIESAWRLSRCRRILDTDETFNSSLLFTTSYVLCIVAVLIELKKYDFFKSPLIRNMLTVLHALDGIIALLLGFAVYFRSPLLLSIGLIAMTKFFLLHLLSRMVTGQAAFGRFPISLQTTKTFLHHVGSYIFIAEPSTALITGFWRFVSMNGHAAMTLRDKLSKKTYESLMWRITHARNLAVATVLTLCLINPQIRRGFALSASGHVAYMLVRLGPVFRIGTMYLEDPDERRRWTDELTDRQRLRLLLAGKYPWYSLELGLLATACAYFLYLRLTTTAIMTDDCRFV